MSSSPSHVVGAPQAQPEAGKWGVTELVPRGTGLGALKLLHDRAKYEDFDRALEREEHRTLIAGWTSNGINPLTLRANETTAAAEDLVEPGKSRKRNGAEAEAHCGLELMDKPAIIPLMLYCDPKAGNRVNNYITRRHPSGKCQWTGSLSEAHEQQMREHFDACMEGKAFPRRMDGTEKTQSGATAAVAYKWPTHDVSGLCQPDSTVFQTVG
ncbi:hypothetical protein PG985_011310 [Apiospora marii]|uniref:Uncharacterized protein n=1 Tax=Apiospora marii TaxID=335849 RepID=A0ABR1SV46_9PEZI